MRAQKEMFLLLFVLISIAISAQIEDGKIDLENSFGFIIEYGSLGVDQQQSTMTNLSVGISIPFIRIFKLQAGGSIFHGVDDFVDEGTDDPIFNSYKINLAFLLKVFNKGFLSIWVGPATVFNQIHKETTPVTLVRNITTSTSLGGRINIDIPITRKTSIYINSDIGYFEKYEATHTFTESGIVITEPTVISKRLGVSYVGLGFLFSMR